MGSTFLKTLLFLLLGTAVCVLNIVFFVKASTAMKGDASLRLTVAHYEEEMNTLRRERNEVIFPSPKPFIDFSQGERVEVAGYTFMCPDIWTCQFNKKESTILIEDHTNNAYYTIDYERMSKFSVPGTQYKTPIQWFQGIAKKDISAIGNGAYTLKYDPEDSRRDENIPFYTFYNLGSLIPFYINETISLQVENGEGSVDILIPEEPNVHRFRVDSANTDQLEHLKFFLSTRKTLE